MSPGCLMPCIVRAVSFALSILVLSKVCQPLSHRGVVAAAVAAGLAAAGGGDPGFLCFLRPLRAYPITWHGFLIF